MNLVVEKSSHALEFGILAALLVRALASTGRNRWRVFGVALAIAWLYALADEYHQSFVPGRSSDWSDILFDWLGATLGAGLWLYWWEKRNTM
jgi:VanZ family protein